MTVDTLKPLLSRMRRDVCWLKPAGKAPVCVKEHISEAKLKRHFNGGPAVGAAHILPGESVTMVATLDMDSHGGETSWPEMEYEAGRICEALEARGMRPTAFRSTGGRGIHIYLIWDEPQDARSVRQFLADILATTGYAPGTRGVSNNEVEVFPKQDSIPFGGYGNMVVLPLAGQSVPLDPLLGYAPAARDFPVEWEPSPPVPSLAPLPAPELPVVAPTVSTAEIRRALDAIPNDTEPLDYDTWRNVIFAIHHATNGDDEGLVLAHEFSARSGKYDADFLNERVWPYIHADRPGGITDGYILNLAAEYGFCRATPDDFEALPPLPDPFITDTLDPGNPFTPLQAAEFANQVVGTHWLVKNVFPANSLAVMYGASGSGKSFMALDMCIAIARGDNWRGHRTHAGRVVYVAAEGAPGFRRRLHAFARQYSVPLDSIDVWVIPKPPSLLDPAVVKQLIAAIKPLMPVALVVLDTFAQVTAGGNENSSEDMGKALKHAQKVGEVLGCAVLLIHHSGKDETRGARGWSGIKAALDAEFEVVRSEHDRAMTVTKLKDGEEGEEFGFRLLEIVIGEDDEGENVTSCVVEHGEVSARQVKARKKLGANEVVVQRVLLDLAIGQGGWVGIERVIEVAMDELAAPGEGARDRRPEVLRRAIKKMVDGGYFEASGDEIRDKSQAGGEEK